MANTKFILKEIAKFPIYLVVSIIAGSIIGFGLAVILGALGLRALGDYIAPLVYILATLFSIYVTYVSIREGPK